MKLLLTCFNCHHETAVLTYEENRMYKVSCHCGCEYTFEHSSMACAESYHLREVELHGKIDRNRELTTQLVALQTENAEKDKEIEWLTALAQNGKSAIDTNKRIAAALARVEVERDEAVREAERLKDIMCEHGIMKIPNKYPVGRPVWNIRRGYKVQRDEGGAVEMRMGAMTAIIYPKLEQWMANNEINEKWLSTMIPASHTTIRNWLHGRTDMQLGDARRFAAITGISMDELFQTKESRHGTAIPKAGYREVAGMANFDCCGCRNEPESRDAYPCNCCLRNEVLFADSYEEEAAQREARNDAS